MPYYSNSLDFIKEYLHLQNEVYHHFIEQKKVTCSNDYIRIEGDVCGVIELDWDWYYRKHGAGVYFQNMEDNVVVDIESHFTKPYLFSVHRLVAYFNSRYNTEISDCFLDDMVNNLCNKGLLYSMKDELEGPENNLFSLKT